MKSFLLMLGLVAGSFAHAANVTCTTADGSESMTYFPDVPGFQLEGQSEIIKVSGRTEVVDSDGEGRSVFQYPLANGLSARITWYTSETEVLRNLPARAEKMELLSVDGKVAITLTRCSWK